MNEGLSSARRCIKLNVNEQKKRSKRARVGPPDPSRTSQAHLDVAVGAGDDVDAVPVLLVLQDAGVVLGREDEQQVFALTLRTQ